MQFFTAKQFIKENPTIGFCTAVKLLEEHGYSFPAFSVHCSIRTRDNFEPIKHGMSGSSDPALRETTIDSKTLFDWMGY